MRDWTKTKYTNALGDLGNFTAFGGGASTTFSSPAITGADLDGSSAPNSTHLGTVSPGELLLHDQYSAPNSTAFTNLTTPSTYGESPDFENYDVSPNFGHQDTGFSETWFPLFPRENTTTDQATVSIESPVEAPVELENNETDSLPRRKSIDSPSASHHGRHSSVAGVNARRRDKPLPPIVVDDPNDTVAMKRARNTLAARKSRQRKAQKLEELEEKIAELEKERDHWKRIAMSRPSGA
ncbi:putative bZIP transcription factor [Rosellinia necatrix]|uniref:Cross-pathway control protein 1 n=1 Tax=Rosellinia necatrix TaxID=77044 RepID=A0A1W2TFF0_ROSNE|nr:putative bZIP transcription factor [Rosellinia necatrix]